MVLNGGKKALRTTRSSESSNTSKWWVECKAPFELHSKLYSWDSCIDDAAAVALVRQDVTLQALPYVNVDTVNAVTLEPGGVSKTQSDALYIDGLHICEVG